MCLTDYRGIYPAFYACYDDSGNVSFKRCKKLADHLFLNGVQGLYVNGSSGECIYLSVSERKKILEAVMEAVGGKIRIIAHVACNNTHDSIELAKHAENIGVDAIAAIPPIYFRLSNQAIAEYWNTISNSAPNTDFIIYNIPQLAGVSLTRELFQEMLKNPRLRAVKNSSMSSYDIQIFRSLSNNKVQVFNGPDEQYIAGRIMGACGGIGGTYAVMPKLFLAAEEAFISGQLDQACQIQDAINKIIETATAGEGHLYAVLKEILRYKGIFCGEVRAPLPPLRERDKTIAISCLEYIKQAEDKI